MYISNHGTWDTWGTYRVCVCVCRHQQLANHDSNKRRHALSYAHFLAPSFSLE